ncbi:MAG: hypothetical protein ACRCWB_08570 [Enterovibrio sp.]
MYYLYVLEGQLKYETIKFEKNISFVLYRDNFIKTHEYSDNDDVYFLKSDIDITINVDLSENKIALSDAFHGDVSLFDKHGNETKFKSDKEIKIDDAVKFKIANVDFSFLINTNIEPVLIDDAPVNHRVVKSRKINLLEYKKYFFYFFALLVFVIILVILLNRDTGTINGLVVFNSEAELMRANLIDKNKNEIVVKTNLESEFKKYLSENGYRYFRFELEPAQGNKYDAVVYVFNNEIQSAAFPENKLKWVNKILTRKVDVIHMFDDFNRLASKYKFRKINELQKTLDYTLVEIYFDHDNLKFDSLQRDLKIFEERWGRNYIEFNVNLKKRQEEQYNFILKGTDNDIIKSGKSFYLK